MNSLEMARMAYATPGAPVRTPRATEYDLFARVTGRLRMAAVDPGAAKAALVKALHDNVELWTTLAVDVADEGNRLPRELRARLFYLARFTQVHTRNVLKGEAEPGPLIDINTAVMRGLAAKEGGA